MRFRVAGVSEGNAFQNSSAADSAENGHQHQHIGLYTERGGVQGNTHTGREISNRIHFEAFRRVLLLIHSMVARRSERAGKQGNGHKGV